MSDDYEYTDDAAGRYFRLFDEAMCAPGSPFNSFELAERHQRNHPGSTMTATQVAKIVREYREHSKANPGKLIATIPLSAFLGEDE